jgi:Ni,Fe-hydrogenase III small subunit/NAD-dependent dihydropyrimidine dehydrogenase PreA subunit
MLRVIRARLKQKYRTIGFPDQEPVLPPDYLGRPQCDAAKCRDECSACIGVCPTEALAKENGAISLDMGRCLFCTDCMDACPAGAIAFSKDYRFASTARDELIVGDHREATRRAPARDVRAMFKKSLKLRQVSAGGCNACEADVNVLNTVVFDLGRFGIQFVASPRHADGLLVTGPVSRNMELALKKTYEALAEPKVVIAVGTCAISGGIFADHPEARKGAAEVVPVDLYVPGCPPHPITVLDGLLRWLGRIK